MRDIIYSICDYKNGKILDFCTKFFVSYCKNCPHGLDYSYNPQVRNEVCNECIIGAPGEKSEKVIQKDFEKFIKIMIEKINELNPQGSGQGPKSSKNQKMKLTDFINAYENVKKSMEGNVFNDNYVYDFFKNVYEKYGKSEEGYKINEFFTSMKNQVDEFFNKMKKEIHETKNPGLMLRLSQQDFDDAYSQTRKKNRNMIDFPEFKFDIGDGITVDEYFNKVNDDLLKFIEKLKEKIKIAKPKLEDCIKQYNEIKDEMQDNMFNPSLIKYVYDEGYTADAFLNNVVKSCVNRERQFKPNDPLNDKCFKPYDPMIRSTYTFVDLKKIIDNMINVAMVQNEPSGKYIHTKDNPHIILIDHLIGNNLVLDFMRMVDAETTIDENDVVKICGDNQEMKKRLTDLLQLIHGSYIQMMQYTDNQTNDNITQLIIFDQILHRIFTMSDKSKKKIAFQNILKESDYDKIDSYLSNNQLYDTSEEEQEIISKNNDVYFDCGESTILKLISYVLADSNGKITLKDTGNVQKCVIDFFEQYPDVTSLNVNNNVKVKIGEKNISTMRRIWGNCMEGYENVEYMKEKKYEVIPTVGNILNLLNTLFGTNNDSLDDWIKEMNNEIMVTRKDNKYILDSKIEFMFSNLHSSMKVIPDCKLKDINNLIYRYILMELGEHDYVFLFKDGIEMYVKLIQQLNVRFSMYLNNPLSRYIKYSSEHTVNNINILNNYFFNKDNYEWDHSENLLRLYMTNYYCDQQVEIINKLLNLGFKHKWINKDNVLCLYLRYARKIDINVVKFLFELSKKQSEKISWDSTNDPFCEYLLNPRITEADAEILGFFAEKPFNKIKRSMDQHPLLTYLKYSSDPTEEKINFLAANAQKVQFDIVNNPLRSYGENKNIKKINGQIIVNKNIQTNKIRWRIDMNPLLLFVSNGNIQLFLNDVQLLILESGLESVVWNSNQLEYNVLLKYLKERKCLNIRADVIDKLIELTKGSPWTISENPLSAYIKSCDKQVNGIITRLIPTTKISLWNNSKEYPLTEYIEFTKSFNYEIIDTLCKHAKFENLKGKIDPLLRYIGSGKFDYEIIKRLIEYVKARKQLYFDFDPLIRYINNSNEENPQANIIELFAKNYKIINSGSTHVNLLDEKEDPLACYFKYMVTNSVPVSDESVRIIEILIKMINKKEPIKQRDREIYINRYKITDQRIIKIFDSMETMTGGNINNHDRYFDLKIKYLNLMANYI